MIKMLVKASLTSFNSRNKLLTTMAIVFTSGMEEVHSLHFKNAGFSVDN